MLANPAISDQAMHHYLYLPVVNTLTLGIYGMVAPIEEPLAAVEEPEVPLIGVVSAQPTEQQDSI